MTDQTNHLVNATPSAKSSMAIQTCNKDRGPSILTKSITEALSSKRPVKEAKEPKNSKSKIISCEHIACEMTNSQQGL